MNKQKAINIFSVIKQINDSVPYINFGGCGIFAINLYDYFIRTGYKPKLICMDYSGDCDIDIQENNKRIKEAREKNLSLNWDVHVFCHYVVQVGRWLFDSETCYYIDCKDRDFIFDNDELRIVGIIDRPDLEYLVSNGRSWNSTFNRKKYKPVIENFLNNLKKESHV